ncbi:MAG: hypothetical protein DMF75_06735 [Acidobacteria bacterium]|nr:MAG: hypothetical protein DMF75_06735 [Acidobacteriota bacterium]
MKQTMKMWPAKFHRGVNDQRLSLSFLRYWAALLLNCSILFNVFAQSSGGSYQLTNSVIAGGGGTSQGTSNGLAQDSTIGEHAAGTLLRNPPFSLTSGYGAANLGLTPTAAPGSISGRITTSDGSPLDGVVVQLSGATSRSAVTDASGFNNWGNTTFVGGLKHATMIFVGQGANPIDNSAYFVRQQYRDFLNREPDDGGWAFWITNIDAQCYSTYAVCRLPNRINVSAAFFLSTEFQETGYLVYRTYKAAYGNLPGAPVPIRFSEFLPDTQQIGQGVVVGQSGWEQALETNKQNFMTNFMQRSRFTSIYPASMSAQQFVDALYTNAGLVPSSAPNRPVAISEFNSTTPSDPAARARALRDVAEDPMLTQQEFNRAFVLMQYFGYLRRNPNNAPDSDFSGYNFWLGKLNQFGGNYQSAEMVKAFIVSTEYRQRFGP